MQAYCMKCRAKKEMKNPVSIKMKNGKPATKAPALVAARRCSKSGRARAVVFAYS